MNSEAQETEAGSGIPRTEAELIQDRIRYLRDNTDFVSTLFESLVGYAIIAADFDGTIIAYNEGAHQIYGYSPEEVIGKETIEIFFPKEFIEAGRLEQLTRELFSAGRFSCEGEKVKKNGSRFPARMLFTITRDKAGQVIGFIEIAEDLTERIKAEEEALRARENAERIERLEEELRSLAGLSSAPQTSVTARMYGAMTLLDGFPETFSMLVSTYAEVMELALEQQAYKVKHDISGRLGAMAETLGFHKAGPRDVVDIHSTALKEKTRKAETSEKRKAYTGEGWIMVLELMGHLASYYRNRAQSVSTPADRQPENKDEYINKEAENE